MSMSPRIRSIVAALVAALAVTACGDSFFFEPAERSVPVRLAYGLAPEFANLATPQEDFDNADQADVRIEGGGRVLFDGVVSISRASDGVNKVAQVRVQVGEDEQIAADVTVELLRDGRPVLRGSTGLTITAGGSSTGGVFGTYDLTSVGGLSIPATFRDESGPGCDIRIGPGSITLNSGGSFTLRILEEEIDRTGETAGCGESFEFVITGTFERSGDTIVLTVEGETVSGTLSGGTLTLNDPDDGEVFRFERSEGGANSTEIFLEPVAGGDAAINGTVVNSLDGELVTGARVELLSGTDATAGSPVASATTSSSGRFSLTGLAAGDYTLVVTATGFIQARQNVSVAAGETVTRQVALSRNLGEGETRIVLTWGDSPSDLDSHITGPDGEGGRFHVYFSNPGSQTASPFVTLDTDETDGFGPETITIWQQFPGTYCYSVDNYSESPDLSTSQATVEVFQGGDRVATFGVPGGSGNLWTVFSLDANGITPVNRLETGTEPGVCQ